MLKIPLMESGLIAKANEELRKLDWYEDGMEIKAAEMMGHTLVMRATGMTNAAGVVRADLIERFDVFARWFADRYTLAESASE